MRVTGAAWERMWAQALEEYPLEACGMLLGRGGCVEEAFNCRNAAAGERARRFLLEPADQIEGMRVGRERGLEVVGYYHSHPDERAYFSKSDVEGAWPGVLNVVLSVRGGERGEARAFVMADGVVTEEELSPMAAAGI